MFHPVFGYRRTLNLEDSSMLMRCCVMPVGRLIALAVFLSLLSNSTSAEQITAVEVSIEMEKADPNYRGQPKSWDKLEAESVAVDILYGNRIVGTKSVGGGQRWVAKPAGAEDAKRKRELKRAALHFLGDLAIGLIRDQIKQSFKAIESVSTPQDLASAKEAWETIQRLQSALLSHEEDLRRYQNEALNRPDIRQLRDRESFTHLTLYNSQAFRKQTITVLDERRAALAENDPIKPVLSSAVAMLRSPDDEATVAALRIDFPPLPEPRIFGTGSASSSGINLSALSSKAAEFAAAIDRNESAVKRFAGELSPSSGPDRQKIARELRSNIESAASSHQAPPRQTRPSTGALRKIFSSDAMFQAEFDRSVLREIETRDAALRFSESMDRALAPIRPRLNMFHESFDLALEAAPVTSKFNEHERRLIYTNEFIEKVETVWRRYNRVMLSSADLLSELTSSGLREGEGAHTYPTLVSLLTAQESRMYVDEYIHRFVIKLRMGVPAWDVDRAYLRIASPTGDGWRFRVSVIGSLEESRTADPVTEISAAPLEDDDETRVEPSTDSWLKVELLSPDAVFTMGGDLAFQPPGRAPADPTDPQKKHRNQTEHTWRFQRID